VPGLTNDTAELAQFQFPSAVAVAPDGTIVVADAGNNAIRRVTFAGVATRVAGGTVGATEGSGTNAQFSQPGGVTVDPTGNVFIADTGNNRVRRISNGQTTTTTVATAANGKTMASPGGICADRSGNLFVADTGNFRVLRIAAGSNTAVEMAGSGAVGTADGTGAAASFRGLRSVACDFSGNVYVGDGGTLRRITSAGVVSTPRVTLDGADTVFFSLNITCDRNADGTVLFATDDQLNTVYRLTRDADGNYDAQAVAGDGTAGFQNGTGTGARFRAPFAPAVRNGAVLIVPDTENHVLRKVE
jgi:sugar lactone lactonase YvrE